MHAKLAMAGVAMAMVVLPAMAQDSGAQAVLDLTKMTQATYSNYGWTKVSIPGQPYFEELSAEFHSGHLHRFENPRDRVIADCSAQTGVRLTVDTGQIDEGPHVAASACGISTESPITSMTYLGVIETAFGDAKRVRITDAVYVREYDVSKEGALLRSVYALDRPDRTVVVQIDTVKLNVTVPDARMFTRESLSQSYLPATME